MNDGWYRIRSDHDDEPIDRIDYVAGDMYMGIPLSVWTGYLHGIYTFEPVVVLSPNEYADLFARNYALSEQVSDLEQALANYEAIYGTLSRDYDHA